MTRRRAYMTGIPSHHLHTARNIKQAQHICRLISTGTLPCSEMGRVLLMIVPAWQWCPASFDLVSAFQHIDGVGWLVFGLGCFGIQCARALLSMRMCPHMHL